MASNMEAVCRMGRIRIRWVMTVALTEKHGPQELGRALFSSQKLLQDVCMEY